MFPPAFQHQTLLREPVLSAWKRNLRSISEDRCGWTGITGLFLSGMTKDWLRRANEKIQVTLHTTWILYHRVIYSRFFTIQFQPRVKLKFLWKFQQNSMWFWLIWYECYCAILNMRTLWKKLCNEEVYPNHGILCKTSYEVMTIALACECICCGTCAIVCFLQPGKSWSSSLSHLAGNRISQVECSSAQIDQMTTCSNDFRPRQPSVIQFSIS